MATYTENLNLVKPDLSDSASPVPFNTNADIIDAQIAELNRYKATIDDINNTTTNTKNTVENVRNDVNTMNVELGNLAYTVGNLTSLLDEINGEVI